MMELCILLMEPHLHHCLDFTVSKELTTSDVSSASGMKSNRAKLGMCGGWSKAAKQMQLPAIICAPMTEVTLLCCRNSALCLYKLQEYMLSIFLIFQHITQSDTSRHEFGMHYTINVQEINDHDFASKGIFLDFFGAGKPLPWHSSYSLLFSGLK
jgi:hypothetical protein